ncbi:MAG: HEPN domain-containing protein [Spirochaetaceae bacterium]|nr:HEPN domain-containing protein [Spirochaetaceae bacterium]
MSRLRQGNGDDYPEAAGKHLKDAGVLMTGSRPDGAAYLAGYVVECALKALIQVQTGRGLRSHDLAGIRRSLGAIAAQAGPQTQRHFATAAALLSNARILSWNPEMRYRAGGRVTSTVAGSWLQEAGAVYSRVIGGLRLDGVI